MKTLYKKILDLELWHDYYLGQPASSQPLPSDYDISDMLLLVPTSDCKRVLQNLRWVFRPQRQGAMIFAEVDQAEKDVFYTKIFINRPYSLTFWLVVRDPRFANFTNLPFTLTRDRIYHFSNSSGNSQGQTLFLTQPLPSYDLNTSYRLGQLVTYGGKTWEAVRDRIAASDIPNPEDWDAIPASQYVSELDQLSRQELLKSCAIFNGNLQELILSDSGANLDAWGLVEILLNSSQVPSAFSVVHSENGRTLIQPKTYVIRFKNRATHWRYRYERPHGFTPEELITLNFEFADDKTYFTQRPQGLLQKPKSFLTDAQDHWLPIPQVTLIKPETKDQNTAIYSDIYL